MKKVLIPNASQPPAYSLIRTLNSSCSEIYTTRDPRQSKTRFISRYYKPPYNVSWPNYSWMTGNLNDYEDDEIIYIKELIRIYNINDLDVIIPANERDIFLLSKYEHLFPEDVKVSNISKQLYSLLADKKKAVKLSKNHKFPVPKSFCLGENVDINKSDYPLIIKASLSTGSKAVYKAYNYQQLSSYAKKFDILGRDYIIQEYVKGSTERSLHYLFDKNSECVLKFCIEKLHFLNPSFSTAIKIIEDAPELDIGETILRDIKFSGFCVIQTKLDEVSGENKLIEFSPKFGNNSRILLKMIPDIPNFLLGDKEFSFNNAQTPKQGETGVSILEDLACFILVLFLDTKSIKDLGFLFKSYATLLLSRPSIDIYFSNLLKDPLPVIAYYKDVANLLFKKRVDLSRKTPSYISKC